jgi:phosphoribosylamine--glycine ligase
MVNVLIIGSGGREHALAWKLNQSPKVGKIFIAPGNAGTAGLGENVNIKAADVIALADFAAANKINLTVVGPDDSLALGVVDEFKKRGLKIWGPSKAAAQIEASKAFAKELMKDNGIPTAEFKTFSDYGLALQYIEQKGAPIVIKASGLALGKGVSVCLTLDEAKNFLQDVMVNKIFGASGTEVVIEEFLQGQEFSIHVFSDGTDFRLLPPAQDHKAIYDGNTGPNTGGMGTVAPLPWVTNELLDKVSSNIVKPALDGLKKLGTPFVGLLYPGLIVQEDDPLARGSSSCKVIEFNARFGDPETQSLMRLLKTDLFDILEACVNGKLNALDIEWEKKFACCIVLASGGYPGKYEKGLPITGVEEASKLEDVVIFHAGTKLDNRKLPTNGLPAKALATAGGRVLGVTATADNLQTALDKAYAAVKLIHFDGMHYRTDIGVKSLNP